MQHSPPSHLWALKAGRSRSCRPQAWQEAAWQEGLMRDWGWVPQGRQPAAASSLHDLQGKKTR